MAAEGMRTFFEATEKDDATWPFPVDPNLSLQENRLSASIKMANKQIFDRSCSDRSTQGMGTTIVGLLLCPEKGIAHVAHVGDSRAYRVRAGKIEPLTRDHSLVNDYLMMMPDMPKEAMDILPKNVITRALGMQDSVVVDPARTCARAIRFCCARTGSVSGPPIAYLRDLVEERDLDACAKRLVEESNAAGGEDNVTVVVVSLDP